MDYVSIYARFIESRKKVPLFGYAEAHHILPRSLGGDDQKTNIVVLSARDHYFAHCLLAKIHGGKMWSALHSMVAMRKKGQRFAQGRMVQVARWEAAKVRSLQMQGLWASGEFKRSRTYGPMSQETKDKIASGNKGLKRAEESIQKVIAAKRLKSKQAVFVKSDGSRILGTVHDLCDADGQVSKAMALLLVRGKVKSASGWMLEGTDPKSINGRDVKVRTFLNKDGREFIGTAYDFKTEFHLDSGVVSNLIHGKNRVQSFKGWKLSSEDGSS